MATLRDETCYITLVKVKWSCYRPGVAQWVCSVIAVLFLDRGTRRWVVSNTPRPHFTPGKDTAPTLQEAGWAPRPGWTGGKSCPHRDSIPDRPGRSQSLYRLSYRAHYISLVHCINKEFIITLCRFLFKQSSATRSKCLTQLHYAHSQVMNRRKKQVNGGACIRKS